MTGTAYSFRLRVGLCIVFVALGLSGCAKENSVTRFLDDASNTVNTLDTRIAGSSSTATACNPRGQALAPVQSTSTYFAGRSFRYLRGERAKGKISYNSNGTFNWKNENGDKSGTGTWTTKGNKWCEAFDAGPSNAAVSQRCWPVQQYRGALCFGLTRLLPDQGGDGSESLF